jgi:putative intracellular protease/amidase
MSVLRILGAGLSLLSLVPLTVATIPEGTQPKTFNFLIFPGVDAIDIMGPLEVLSTTAMKYKIDVRFIAETLEPISSAPLIASQNAQNSSAWPILTPTHTFESAPEADVLLVPGGLGMRKPELNSTLKFISDSTEKVKHVITICTGSALAARAGIMNGRKVR